MKVLNQGFCRVEGDAIGLINQYYQVLEKTIDPALEDKISNEPFPLETW